MVLRGELYFRKQGRYAAIERELPQIFHALFSILQLRVRDQEYFFFPATNRETISGMEWEFHGL